MRRKLLGLWVLVALLLLPGALSMEIETDKLSYKTGDTISVSVSENAQIEYNGIIKNGKHAEFTAVKSDNKILVNDEYQRLVHVSDGKVIGTCISLGIFGIINMFVITIIKKCWKIFI